jgi:hypothetical protein
MAHLAKNAVESRGGGFIGLQNILDIDFAAAI